MSFMESPTTILLFISIFIFNLYLRVLFRKNTKPNHSPPQPRGALPLFGHLHLLRRQKPLHLTLADMADEVGPVFLLRLGISRILIVSGYDAAKECFTTNDKVLAGKPSNTAGKLIGYDHAIMGSAQYGSYWRLIRMITVTKLLSKPSLDKLMHARTAEISAHVSKLHRHCGSAMAVDMAKWISDLNYNVVMRMVAGNKYMETGEETAEARRFRKAAGDYVRVFGAFVTSDLLPFVGWLDVGGHEKKMRKVFEEVDEMVGRLLVQHRARRTEAVSGTGGNSGGEVKDGEWDFMDVVLSVAEEEDSSPFDPDTVVKALCLALIIGGVYTITSYLTWTMALLLNNNGVLKKVQEELDAQIGRDRLAEYTDIKDLNYLQAVVKESFRLCPAGEQLVLHQALEDCCITGFSIPAGTCVAINIWKLHRDPGRWPDPLEFRPERFLTSHAEIDVRGQHYELLPFRAGRRVCPGISLSLQVMHLTLARLLQAFDVETPENRPVEMDQGLGLIKFKSLDALLTARLPERLYQL